MSAVAAASTRETRHRSWLQSATVSVSTGRSCEASRLVAKVDSAAVQDGFDLYLHGFIVAGATATGASSSRA